MKKILCAALAALSVVGMTFAGLFSVRAETGTETEIKTTGKTGKACTSYGALFESENVEIADGKTSASYTNITPKEGVLFSTEEEGGTVRFLNKLDLSSNKRTDALVQLMITPTMQDTPDFYELVITLEDAYDPENKLTISFYRGTYDTLIGMVKAQAPGQVLAGYNANNKKMHSETDRGTPVYTSFNGIGVAGLDGTLTLGLDYSALALYASPGVYSHLENGTLVTKFADPKYVSQEWEGFTTGEVYISFRFSSLKRTRAEFMLLTLNGQSLAGTEIVDQKDPVVSVDTAGNEETPEGLAAYPYPLFPVTVFDEIDGDMPGADITVYRDKSGGEVFCSGFSTELRDFIPDREGVYIVSYTAEDKSGRKTVREFEVMVKESLGELTYVPDGEYPESAKVGEKVLLPGGHAENGSGNVKVTTVIRRIGEEEAIAVSDGGFVAREQGMYEVTVKLTDYLGRQYTLVRRITVKENDIPIIEEPFVPRYVVNGKPVVFDGFVAYDYASTSGYPQQTDRKSIRIYDEKMQLLKELDYSDRSYTPDIANGGEIVVEYRAACLYDAEKVALFQKRVTVLDVDEIADYFHDGEGKTRQEPQETSVVYYTEEEGAGREFINALPATGFSFTFTVPLAANNFDRVAVWLEDAKDPAIRVKISVEKNTADPQSIYSKLYVNDKGEPADILGSFYETTNNFFIIALNGRSISDASSGAIMSISETVYGEKFEGFPSGKVYLSFAMEGVAGESAVEVSRVLNQMMSDIDDDYINPIILVSEELTRDRHYGESVKIPAATAADVLDQKVTLTVSVTDRRGNYLIKDSAIDEDLYFVARSYGVYKIEYRAVDSRGNISTKNYSLEILDAIKPEMEVEGKVPGRVKAGETIALPSAAVTDNVSVNLQVYVFVIDESGKMSMVEDGKYCFSQKGRYTVRYYCHDDEFNFVMIDYTVVAE